MNNLSIMMPFYNSEKTIENAINSINNQTILNKNHCPNINLILIDNNSKDLSRQICLNTFKNINPKIKTHILDCDIQGISPARNKALYYAFSLDFEYLAMLDSDDEWLQEKLEIQIDFLKENNQCDILGTQISYFNEKDNNFYNSKYPIDNVKIKEYIKKGINPIANSSCLINKNVFLKCGSYEPTYHLCEDFHLWVRASNWFNFSNIDQYLCRYRFEKPNNQYVESCGPTCAYHFFYAIKTFHKHEYN